MPNFEQELELAFDAITAATSVSSAAYFKLLDAEDARKSAALESQRADAARNSAALESQRADAALRDARDKCLVIQQLKRINNTEKLKIAEKDGELLLQAYLPDSGLTPTQPPEIVFTREDVDAVMAAGNVIPTVMRPISCPDGIEGCLLGHYVTTGSPASLALFSIARRIEALVSKA